MVRDGIRADQRDRDGLGRKQCEAYLADMRKYDQGARPGTKVIRAHSTQDVRAQLIACLVDEDHDGVANGKYTPYAMRPAVAVAVDVGEADVGLANTTSE